MSPGSHPRLVGLLDLLLAGVVWAVVWSILGSGLFVVSMSLFFMSGIVL